MFLVNEKCLDESILYFVLNICRSLLSMTASSFQRFLFILGMLNSFSALPDVVLSLSNVAVFIKKKCSFSN